MAEMLASGAVRTLTGSLSSLLEKEIAIAWGLKEELEKLESTLSTIRLVLQDAEAKKVNYEPLKNWLRKLKDAAYDAEDIIDECKTEALRCEAADTMKRAQRDSQTHLDGQKFLLLGWKYLKKDVRML